MRDRIGCDFCDEWLWACRSRSVRPKAATLARSRSRSRWSLVGAAPGRRRPAVEMADHEGPLGAVEVELWRRDV
jgi:hypothetical protein